MRLVLVGIHILDCIGDIFKPTVFMAVLTRYANDVCQASTNTPMQSMNRSACVFISHGSINRPGPDPGVLVGQLKP